MKIHYSVIILLLASLAINPILAQDNLSCIGAGGFLVGAFLCAHQALQEYNKTKSLPYLAKLKGKQLYNHLDYFNNSKLNSYLKKSEHWLATYGPTCGWAVATVVLAVIGLKLLSRCLQE